MTPPEYGHASLRRIPQRPGLSDASRSRHAVHRRHRYRTRPPGRPGRRLRGGDGRPADAAVGRTGSGCRDRTQPHRPALLRGGDRPGAARHCGCGPAQDRGGPGGRLEDPSPRTDAAGHQPLQPDGPGLVDRPHLRPPRLVARIRQPPALHHRRGHRLGCLALHAGLLAGTLGRRVAESGRRRLIRISSVALGIVGVVLVA